jgi:hypothetical protein
MIFILNVNYQLSQQLDWFVSNPDAHRLLCEQPGFVHLFMFSSAEAKDELYKYQQSLCNMDPDDLNKLWNSTFNMQHLADIVSVGRCVRTHY